MFRTDVTEKRRGRPKLPNPKKPFSCLLHDAEQDFIKTTATAMSISKAEVVKLALNTLKGDLTNG